MSDASERLGGDAHVGNYAELFALGMLEPRERANVEAHIAACAACARAVGEAATTVAALEDAFVPLIDPPARLAARIAGSAQASVAATPAPATHKVMPFRRAAPRITPSLLATAAALVLAAAAGVTALFEHAADVGQAARDSAVLATIAQSHFLHVTLAARRMDAPVSKVLFARDGTWFYIVVDSAECNCRIVAHAAGQTRDLGAPEARGSTATLFVRDFPRPDALDLVDPSGRIIASAMLRYLGP